MREQEKQLLTSTAWLNARADLLFDPGSLTSAEQALKLSWRTMLGWPSVLVKHLFLNINSHNKPTDDEENPTEQY